MLKIEIGEIYFLLSLMNACVRPSGLPVPEHMIPYQAEAGPHPSFEDIQMIVYHNKSRPKFPDVWKDSNQVCTCCISSYLVS